MKKNLIKNLFHQLEFYIKKKDISIFINQLIKIILIKCYILLIN